MKNRTKIIVLGVACLVVLYFSGPIVAGATRTGDRTGPVLYPAELHTPLYIIGHEFAFQEKPRQLSDSWMYRRPLFYGLSRRLKSEGERQAYIEMARVNQSPRINELIEMNKKANHQMPGTAAPPEI